MKLGALLGACGIAVPEGAADLDVRSLVYDSRKATPGSLFVAIDGFHRDGHAFIDDAIGRGAAATLTQREEAAKGHPAVLVDATTPARQTRTAAFGTELDLAQIGRAHV